MEDLTLEQMKALPFHDTITMPIRFLPIIFIVIRLMPVQPDWNVWTTVQYLVALVIFSFFAYHPIPIRNTNAPNAPLDPTAPLRATILALESTIDDLKEDIRLLDFRLKGQKTLTVRESMLYSRAVAERNEAQYAARDAMDDKAAMIGQKAAMFKEITRLRQRLNDTIADSCKSSWNMRLREREFERSEETARIQAAKLREVTRRANDADLLSDNLKRKVKVLQRANDNEFTTYRKAVAVSKAKRLEQEAAKAEKEAEVKKLTEMNENLGWEVMESAEKVRNSEKKVKELTSSTNGKDFLIENLQRKIGRMEKGEQRKQNAFL